MITTRRDTFKLIGLALALGSLATTAHAHDDGDGDDGFRSGKVFMSAPAARAMNPPRCITS